MMAGANATPSSNAPAAPPEGQPAQEQRADDRDARRETIQGFTSARAAAAPAAPAPRALMETRSTVDVLTTASSDGQSLWSVEGVLIRHSTDGGRTWNAEPVAGTNQLVAGFAPSPTVCWMVGRQGLILRYQDQGGWQRRTAPGAVDLVSVIALDADHATVSTADGRQFRTEDGGQTWARP
jgi:photosystem II stability/assembly factor-like uncharacterized protein